jgi:hypothetical protein
MQAHAVYREKDLFTFNSPLDTLYMSIKLHQTERHLYSVTITQLLYVKYSDQMYTYRKLRNNFYASQ